MKKDLLFIFAKWLIYSLIISLVFIGTFVYVNDFLIRPFYIYDKEIYANKNFDQISNQRELLDDFYDVYHPYNDIMNYDFYYIDDDKHIGVSVIGNPFSLIVYFDEDNFTKELNYINTNYSFHNEYVYNHDNLIIIPSFDVNDYHFRMLNINNADKGEYYSIATNNNERIITYNILIDYSKDRYTQESIVKEYKKNFEWTVR